MGSSLDGVLDVLVAEIEVLERWAMLRDKPSTFLFDKSLTFQDSLVFHGSGSLEIVQVNESHIVRVKQYLQDTHDISVEVSGSGIHDSDWLVALPRGAVWPAADPVVNGGAAPVRRRYKVDVACSTLKDAMQKLLTICAEEKVTSLRASCFPKSIEAKLFDAEMLNTLEFDPKKFSHVAHVVYFHGAYWVGVASESFAVACSDIAAPAHVCKAYFKVQEIVLRCDWASSLVGGVAADIGASPGGWSWYLAAVVGMAKVFAVDPGALALPAEMAEIVHLKKLGLDAIPEIKEHGPLSLYVCDVNMRPNETMDMFMHFVSQGLVLDGCRVAITMKNSCKNKKEWNIVLPAQLERLQGVCPDAREVHLIANTKFETTLIGVVRSSP
mmetsp:Transcript_76798/g.176198  ORF Transcript_76798/g.176198 Transcript_76798/m.176198 type:complete len:383 (-) Transcript_76798:13-1161(-)